MTSTNIVTFHLYWFKSNGSLKCHLMTYQLVSSDTKTMFLSPFRYTRLFFSKGPMR